MKRAGAGDDFMAWKAGVATEMERLHAIAVIPEHGALPTPVEKLSRRRMTLDG